MKLLILSDLHLEGGTSLTVPSETDYDVAVLAGDIHSPGHKAIHWAQRDSMFGAKPVVYVAGNHEFYNAPHFSFEMEAMARAALDSNVHFLNRQTAIIAGVRFLGCMLWTDFQLPMAIDGELDTDIGQAIQVANRRMMDYEAIQIMSPATRAQRYREFKRLLRAEDTLAMHWVDRDWLRRELRTPFAGPTVVVTHHAPAKGSVAEKYAGDSLAPSFVSAMPDEFFEVPVLWIHGHTHTHADYMQGTCRVVSNPRGYRRSDGSFENGHFLPGYVVSV